MIISNGVSFVTALTYAAGLRRVLLVTDGANDPNRTDDLLITSELLYRLSYVGIEIIFRH